MLFSIRNTVLLITISTIFLSCEQKKTEEQSDSTNVTADVEKKYARILFEEMAYDFGKIKQGQIVKHTFVFKNDSDEPLLISNASASCGCTIPEWPKTAVKPGESNKIEVQFNSTGKSGMQNKTVLITANTLPNTTTIVLKGEVEAPALKPKN